MGTVAMAHMIVTTIKLASKISMFFTAFNILLPPSHYLLTTHTTYRLFNVPLPMEMHITHTIYRSFNTSKEVKILCHICYQQNLRIPTISKNISHPSGHQPWLMTSPRRD